MTLFGYRDIYTEGVTYIYRYNVENLIYNSARVWKMKSLWHIHIGIIYTVETDLVCVKRRR